MTENVNSVIEYFVIRRKDMATAFGIAEKDKIVSALRHAAWKHACNEGMKKTSVDQLTSEAGISKGAFYSFYEVKELLFLDVLNQWYQKIFADVEQYISGHSDSNPEELARESIKIALNRLSYRPAARFVIMERDVLLRRVSAEAREKLYRSEEDIVGKLAELCGVTLKTPVSTAVGIIRILLVASAHADEIGDTYDEGLTALIESCCSQLVV